MMDVCYIVDGRLWSFDGPLKVLSFCETTHYLALSGWMLTAFVYGIPLIVLVSMSEGYCDIKLL